MDQKIERWQKQINDLIDEVLDINERKYVFEKEREIIKNNSKLRYDNIFITYLFKNYFSAQVLAISRVVEDDGRTKSFVALLNDLLINFEEIIKSGELDKKFIENINRSGIDDILKNSFKKERENITVSWEEINSDKFDLLKETAILKIFRDKWLAHIDKKRKDVVVVIEYDKLNRIINFLNINIQKYYLLLTNSFMPSLLTGGLEEDEEIFNFSWSNH